MNVTEISIEEPAVRAHGTAVRSTFETLSTEHCEADTCVCVHCTKVDKTLPIISENTKSKTITSNGNTIERNPRYSEMNSRPYDGEYTSEAGF